jgi:hypothetical protein
MIKWLAIWSSFVVLFGTRFRIEKQSKPYLLSNRQLASEDCSVWINRVETNGLDSNRDAITAI